jgi:hypothetical protein
MFLHPRACGVLPTIWQRRPLADFQAHFDQAWTSPPHFDQAALIQRSNQALYAANVTAASQRQVADR